MASGTYSIGELLAETGVSARALREWIRLKVMPRAIGRGRGARYDERHVLRAHAIQYLRTQNVPLRAIRGQLGAMTEEQLRAFVPPKPRATTAEGVPLPPAVPAYPCTTWEMVQLTTGLVLLVNTQHGELVRRIAAAIHQHYGMSS